MEEGCLLLAVQRRYEDSELYPTSMHCPGANGEGEDQRGKEQRFPENGAVQAPGF